jgi:hypothetical protein
MSSEHIAPRKTKRQAIVDAGVEQPLSITYYIDHGKEHVGQAAEIYALFEY